MRQRNAKLPSVMLIVTDLQIGGAPLQVYRLAKGLYELEVPVSVVSLAGDGPVADKIRTLGIDVFPLGAKSIFDLRIFSRFAVLVARSRPDICHSFLMHANVLTRLVAPVICDAKIVSTICTVERENHWHMTLENLTSRRAHKIVCVSRAVRDFCRITGLPANKLTVIRPGIDEESILVAVPARREDIGLSPGTTTLCYLGRLDPIKRIDLILEALKIINNNNINLLIIGDGPQRSYLESLTRHLSLQDQVHFLGFRSDYAALLKICQVYVLASDQEGWGVATTEALAAGLTVVATDVDANREQVIPGRNGYLVSPGNPHRLAEGILAGLKLHETYNSGYCPTPDLADMSYRREVAEYLELYRSLLTEPNGNTR